MFEEPVRFFVDLASNNRPVLDLLYADYTFVNPILAKFYGMSLAKSGPDQWTRVDDARPLGRGGLLADVGFLDRQLAGSAHQSRQARILGRPALAGRTDPGTSARCPRAARRTKPNPAT